MTFTAQEYKDAVTLLRNDAQFMRRYAKKPLDLDTYGKRRSFISSHLGYPGFYVGTPPWAMKNTILDRDQLRRYFDAEFGYPQNEINKYANEPDALEMPVSPDATFAQKLHEVAITLENDRAFYNVYIGRNKHSGMRRDDIARACRRLNLDTPHGAFYEQLRRYFDSTWDVETETADDTASYAKDPTIEFWLDRVRYPEQPRVEKSMANAVFSTATSTVSPVCNPTPKEIPVSKPQVIKVESIVFINGAPAKDFTKADVFNLIAAQEASVADLEKIKNKPKALVKEIEERNAGIQALVDYLDSKEA